jgi:NAD(P)-dependent dehydrogenase (short-subunit alcohol dehydrogenase family)
MDFFNSTAPIDHLISTMRGPAVTDLFAESQTSKVREAFDEKFWTQYHMVRYGLGKMKPTGSIILTSGIASQKSYPGYSWLAGANGAIESLVKSLCAEILPIRINVVSPGFVEKVPHDPVRLEQIKQIEPNFPMERLATQEEVVESYLYLMKNGYTTGNTLVVDGGVLNT